MSRDWRKITRPGRSLPNESALNLLTTFILSFLVAAGGIALYATSRSGAGQTMALAGMIAAGAVMSGGVIGFLFALPRSITVAVPVGGAAAAKELRSITIRPNTNLEEVSDWVAKIIVGLTLTQLNRIPGAASRFFHALGRSLGSSPRDMTFAGSLVIFCSIVGFLMSWLSTRMFVGRWMAASDWPLEAAAAEAARRRDRHMETAIAHARSGTVTDESPPASRAVLPNVVVPESREESQLREPAEQGPAAGIWITLAHRGEPPSPTGRVAGGQVRRLSSTQARR